MLQSLGPGLCFAPIGLTKMFNSGGAVQSLAYETYDHGLIQMFNSDGDVEPLEALNTETTTTHCGNAESGPLLMALVKMVVQGCGEFGAYSSRAPVSVSVNAKRTDFKYDSLTGFVKFLLPVHSEGEFWDVSIEL